MKKNVSPDTQSIGKINNALTNLSNEVRIITKYFGYAKLLKAVFNIYHERGIEGTIEDALSSLSERERQVIIDRFGIGGEQYTLEKAGEKHGVQRERIRQIEAKALRKLRRPLRKGFTTKKEPFI